MDGQKKGIQVTILEEIRLDEIQATVLRIKLKNLDFCNARRREIANIYSNYLKEFPVTHP